MDVKDGKTVKGMNFVNFRNAGDPVALGAAYGRAGADELVYLDITASHEGRKTFTDLVKRIAENINIPFTVGGGIHELGDVERLLAAGADKVSVNSAAIRRPALIREIAANYGSQVCVVAIDADYINGQWVCFLNGGRVPTDKLLFDWAAEAESLGAGEILFTSMAHDGVKTVTPMKRLRNCLHGYISRSSHREVQGKRSISEMRLRSGEPMPLWRQACFISEKLASLT